MDGKPVGIILAGGQARRMGGGDKGLRPFGGGTLLDEIVRRLAPQCARLLLNANGDPARFAGVSLPVIPDHAEDAGAGPLAGILAGLDAAAVADGGTDLALTVPTDVPMLPPDLVARLHAARHAARVPVALARSANRDHPAIALWSLGTRPALRHLLRTEGVRRLSAAQASLGCVAVTWPIAGEDPFHNVNTPADLSALSPPCAEAQHRPGQL